MSISSSKPLGRKRAASFNTPAKPRDVRGPNAGKHRPDPAYVRELIASTGMTYAQLAERMGCAVRSIERWASPAGRIPYPEQHLLERIALANAPRPARAVPAPPPVEPKPSPAPRPLLQSPLSALLALRRGGKPG